MLHAARRCLAVVSLLLAFPFAVPAHASPPAFVEGVVLVGFKPNTPDVARAEARSAVGASRSEALTPLDRTAEKLTLRPGLSVPQAIKALLRNPNVRYAEPDYILTRAAVSNDSYYANGSLWGMYGPTSSPANAFGSNAAAAWAAGHTGSPDVYVGIIDEGIQATHPDLAANMWVNPFDPVDGIDNDGNGRVDDTHGWDFVSNDRSVYDGSPSSASVDSHGTHVAGTIGGVGGNGTGVAGVSWRVKMISGKFLGANGGSTSNAILAVDYFNDLKARHGLNIVATSNSWGGGGYSQALLDAINRGGDRGILFIAAAGNSSANIDGGAYYPAAYQCTTTAAGAARGWDCVMAVASITSTGGLSSFSNYGAANVDIGAPGSGVWSSVPFDSYASYNGTSMATPHVSGAAALCASVNPAITAQQVRAAILTSAVPTSSLAGKTATGGRLDVDAMVSACLPSTKGVSGAPSGLSASAASASSISLSWSDGVSDESYYEVQRGDAACANFTTVAQLPRNATAYTDAGLSASTGYCYRVRAGNAFPSTSAWSATAQAATLAPPPPYACAPTSYQWLSPALTALPMGDDAQAVVALPFAFPFYGNTAASAVVGSNGLLRLDGGTATAFANAAIANAAEPNGYIAPFWDDLNPSLGGTVGTGTVGAAGARQFVVSWDNVPHYSVAGSTLSFQVVLEESTGDFLLNYRDVLAGSAAYDRGASATVGVENPQGTAGTTVSYNTAALADGTAYRCSAGATPPPPPPPPLAPTGLVATPTSSSQVSLTWSDNAADETSYEVERSSNGGGSYVRVATLGAGATTYADAGLAAATAYSYRVRAVSASGASAYSNTASATTLAPPPPPPEASPQAPTNVSAKLSSTRTSVTISWRDRSSNETGFDIGRAPSSAPSSVTVAGSVSANVTRFTDAPGAGSWVYYVRSKNSGGTSAWAGPTSAVTAR